MRFRGGLVFKAHRSLYHSTLGLRVIKTRKTFVALNSRLDSNKEEEEGRGMAHHVRDDEQREREERHQQKHLIAHLSR